MLRLRAHRFESAFASPAPATTETPDEVPPRTEIPTEPSLPSTLRGYCELTTPSWNWGWRHLVALDEVYEQVLAGTLKRLIVELPTRIGKTEKGIRFLSYALERKPSDPLIVGGYNDKYARRLSRKVRRLVAGRVALSRDRNAAEDWETEAGGGLRAAGVGVGIAGLPAAGIYIDDPTKSREDAYSKAHRNRVDEWFREDAYTRLEPDGWIVICMARRHEDDLVGRILASEDGPSWAVVRLPALAEADDPLGRKEGEALCPERFDEAYYAKMERAIGTAAFASLQQQRPAPAKGLIFQSDWFRYYTTRDRPIVEDGFAVPFLPEQLVDHTLSVDCSFKDKKTSDYVAGLSGARRKADVYVLPHQFHDRLNLPATADAVRTLSRLVPNAAKLVEDKANGPAVIQTLRSEIPGLIAIEPKGDKVSRAWAVTPQCESGNVWLPHPQIAPWVKTFLLELVQFPMAANDDYVDAFSQLLRRLMRRIEDEKSTSSSARPRGGSYVSHGA
jgi:predicted phage terminase large subunit-like protein